MIPHHNYDAGDVLVSHSFSDQPSLLMSFPGQGNALDQLPDIENEVKRMKRDAEQLGKEMSGRSEQEQADTLANLRGHMQDLGRVRDLDKVIEEPFWRGTKY